MASVNELDINGTLSNRDITDPGSVTVVSNNISGELDNTGAFEPTSLTVFSNGISGSVNDTNAFHPSSLTVLSSNVLGSLNIPSTLDRTAIHIETTATWNRRSYLTALKGHLYIYSDYTKCMENGREVLYAAIKVGDGTSYLIDMPFTVVGIDHKLLIDHIYNMAIHVSSEDRENWDDKVSTEINGENLIFNI